MSCFFSRDRPEVSELSSENSLADRPLRAVDVAHQPAECGVFFVPAKSRRRTSSILLRRSLLRSPCLPVSSLTSLSEGAVAVVERKLALSTLLALLRRSSLIDHAFAAKRPRPFACSGSSSFISGLSPPTWLAERLGERLGERRGVARAGGLCGAGEPARRLRLRARRYALAEPAALRVEVLALSTWAVCCVRELGVLVELAACRFLRSSSAPGVADEVLRIDLARSVPQRHARPPSSASRGEAVAVAARLGASPERLDHVGVADAQLHHEQRRRLRRSGLVFEPGVVVGRLVGIGRRKLTARIQTVHELAVASRDAIRVQTSLSRGGRSVRLSRVRRLAEPLTQTALTPEPLYASSSCDWSVGPASSGLVRLGPAHRPPIGAVWRSLRTCGDLVLQGGDPVRHVQPGAGRALA